MKVIDLYNLISNKKYDKLPTKIKLKKYDNVFTLREDCSGFKWYGEEVYHSDFGETIHQNLEYVLNCEVETIEEDKKIEKYDTGLTNGRYTEDSIKTGLDTDTTIENIIINMGIEITLVKEKMFEIIDKINSMEVK